MYLFTRSWILCGGGTQPRSSISRPRHSSAGHTEHKRPQSSRHWVSNETTNVWDSIHQTANRGSNARSPRNRRRPPDLIAAERHGTQKQSNKARGGCENRSKRQKRIPPGVQQKAPRFSGQKWRRSVDLDEESGTGRLWPPLLHLCHVGGGIKISNVKPV